MSSCYDLTARGLVIRLDPLLNEEPLVGGVGVLTCRSFGKAVSCLHVVTCSAHLGKLVRELAEIRSLRLARVWSLPGIVAYFIDPPVVDFRMTPGIAQVAELGPLNKVIRDLLQSAIHDQLLLPNVIHVPMVDDEDLVDTASVRDAKPLGVLRVTAPRPSDVSLCFCATTLRDPAVSAL
ncbi:Esyt3 [Symbiodinium sp. CCMP2456]|nr:Esyt3 [Symbiodinium sp. CCMP2456]